MKMYRAVVLAGLLAFASARSFEQEQLRNEDAEVLDSSGGVEAVEVPASPSNDEGRNLDVGFGPFRLFRFPLRPSFPFLHRRDSFPAEADERVADEDASDASAATDAEFIPETSVPSRRPVFPSLSDIFGDFNRRMQVFEDEISNMFRTLIRPPTRTSEEIPEESDDEEPERPGFNIFRPFVPSFRPFGGLFGLARPSEYPDNYKNSTSKTEVINGTKMIVNETIHKGGDENSQHFVHFKVIHLVPEDTDVTEGDVEKVDVKTEKPEQSETEAEELAQILPEANKDGLNPADFGYKVGDNEVDKDVEVVNLPSDSNKAELPSGVDAA